MLKEKFYVDCYAKWVDKVARKEILWWKQQDKYRSQLFCNLHLPNLERGIQGWLVNMAIGVVEFSNGGYEIKKIFA